MQGYDHDHPETLLDTLAEEVIVNKANIVNGFHFKHPEYFAELVERTPFLNKNAFTRERFWHIYKKTEKKPLCELEGCMLPVTWHFARKRHNRYCERSCALKDIWRKRKEKAAELQNQEHP